MISTPPVPPFGNVYVSSGEFAALGGSFQRRTPSHLTCWAWISIRLPQEVMVMCTRAALMVQGFVSNVCGGIPRMDQKRPSKYVIENNRLPSPPPLK